LLLVLLSLLIYLCFLLLFCVVVLCLLVRNLYYISLISVLLNLINGLSVRMCIYVPWFCLGLNNFAKTYSCSSLLFCIFSFISNILILICISLSFCNTFNNVCWYSVILYCASGFWSSFIPPIPYVRLLVEVKVNYVLY
jgi:hypothetical protein